MVEEMDRRMQEYQARIEELEKAAEVEAQRKAERALYGVKRRHDGSPVHQGGSATNLAVGARAEGDTQELTPGTDRQVVVPIIEKVPVKLREKIWEFQYVDLIEFLPEADRLLDSPIVFFKTKDDDIMFDVRKHHKRVQSPQVWLQAFTSYAAVLTTKWPSRAGELFQYLGDILNLANQHPWHQVYSYNVRFRWSVQLTPNKNWVILDHVNLAREIISPSMSMVRRVEPPSKSWSRSPLKETCRKFNAGRCNFGQKCKFLHKCNKCNKFRHGFKDCRQNKQKVNVDNA